MAESRSVGAAAQIPPVDATGRLHIRSTTMTMSVRVRHYVLGTRETFQLRSCLIIGQGYLECGWDVSRAGLPHVPFGMDYGPAGLQHWSR